MTFPNYIIFESYTIALNSSIMLDLYIQQVISILLCGQIFTAIAIESRRSAEEGYSTNEESDLVLIMLCCLFCCLVLTVLLDFFSTPDANTVPKCYILECWIC